MPLFEDIAVRYMTDLIRDFDLEDFQAAGFPGNFGVESAGFTDVTENNPSSGVGGLGHAQWTGRTPTNNRRLLFEQYIEKRRSLGMSASPDDYETNYGMVFRELDGTEGRRVLPKLRLARNVDEAVEIVMTEYERPGILHLDKRKEYGRRALAAFRAAGIDAAELRRQERPGGSVNTGIVIHQPAQLDPIQQLPAVDTGGMNINQILPMVFSVLALIQRKRQDAGKPVDVMSILNDIMRMADTIGPAVSGAAQAVKQPFYTVADKAMIGAGALAAIPVTVAQSTGHMGTAVLGTEPTTAGLLGVVSAGLPIVLGLLGGGSGISTLASLVKGLFSRFKSK
jgi:hypothetical protein